jgi:hypothetical protein
MSQEITDFVCILTSHALAAPIPNKVKANKLLEYYAVLAFEPAAGATLFALAQEAALKRFGNAQVGPGTPVALPVVINAQHSKPIAGIPGDWLIVRANTQFAPYIANERGEQVTGEAVRTLLYAGKKVRAAITAYGWTHDATARRGVNFNLNGIMASNDGERLNIGAGRTANAFAKHANPNASTPTVPGANAPVVTAQPTGNPFAQQAQQAPVLQQQVQAGVATQSANPFAQQAQQAANPFATQTA